ncbi:hypothetical protein C2G38_2179347 [Gigaspora rosea]|uniref:Uncharacterized protein n=1 Tax=Gigaspora rosea TaxID=44941 RepID=A0A397VF09_9GLOM|nr:hypothetical protein C2G38_2179347 [Gigaspora rosea]
MYHINNLLFKLFIENCATLRKLGLYFSKSLELKPEIFYTLGESNQFFLRIQHLSLNEISDGNIEGAITLLKALAKHTTKISTLKINNIVPYYYETQLVHVLINVIKSQEQLRLLALSSIALILEKSGLLLQRLSVEAMNQNFDYVGVHEYSNLEALDDNIRKEVEANVALVPDHYIVVDC